jgi:PEP-CTERM motif
MKLGWNVRVATAAIGLAAAISTSTASAAIVTGSWDPAFEDGSPLAGLGWTATVNLYVPDRCIVQSVPAGFVVNLFGVSLGCGPEFSWNPLAYLAAEIKVVSAEVGIYDVQTGGPDALLDVLRFDSSTLPIQVLGFDDSVNEPTFYIGGTSTAVWGSQSRTDDCQFKLSLNDAENLPTTATSAPFVFYACGGATQFTRSNTRPEKTVYSYVLNSGPNDDVANRIKAATRLEVTANDVPEPGTFTMALLALSLAGLIGRRASR